MRPEPADVFVYRDTSTVEEDLAAAAAAEREAAERRAAAERAAAEREAEYWYGPAEPVTAQGPTGGTRGPFEPLVTSEAGPAAETGPGAPGSAIGEADEPEEPGERHAQKLAQIKDFYLTAEAIGEKNVDKHFDQLLAQQRELIGQYFKDSAVRRSDAGQVAPEDEATEAGATQADAAW